MDTISTTRTFTTAEQALIDQHRDINVDVDNWYEPTFDDFIEFARAFGIDVEAQDISFSGFYSQGDGASFTFSANAYDILMAGIETEQAQTYPRPHTQYVDRFYSAFHSLWSTIHDVFAVPALMTPEGREAAEMYKIDAVRTTHSYCHEGTVRVETECEFEWWTDGDPCAERVPGLNARIYDLKEDGRYQYYIDTLSEQLGRDVERCAGALYAALREEYEYQTDDEQVWEALESCGITPEGEDTTDEDDPCPSPS